VADDRSRVGEAALSLGRAVGLLVDWASPTRMGRLRGAGLCGALAAAITWWADLRFLASERTAIGWAVAGTLAVPVLAAGYWHVWEAMRSAVPRASAGMCIAGLYSVGVGTALHGLAVAVPPLPVSALLWPLGLATAAGVIGSSLFFAWAVLAMPSDYPRAMAFVCPATLTVVVWWASQTVPGWEQSGALAAPLVAHLVFFLISVGLIEYHNPDRWR
jgi:hypothetical protein